MATDFEPASAARAAEAFSADAFAAATARAGRSSANPGATVSDTTGQLHNTLARYRGLIDALPQIVWISNRAGRLVWLNDQWVIYTGRALEATLESDPNTLVHPDDLTVVNERWNAALTNSVACEFQYRLRRHDGVYRWHLARVVPIRDERGEVLHWLATGTDIDDHKRLEEALRASEQRLRDAELALREADRRKDEFLAMLSHELRNPLAPILTAVQLMKLRGDIATPNERGVIERQAQHLVRLVDDLLDVSRVARGKIEINRARVELYVAVSKAVETTSPLMEQKHHRLCVDVPRDGLLVDGDEIRLAQLIGNLLSNAARYTPRGGDITMTARADGDQVVLCVRDNGIGISPELMPRVFEMFVQGPRQADRAEGGLGLGLALVQSLTSLHGGTVEAHSAGPGQGSEFVVRLPLVRASMADHPHDASVARVVPVASTRARTCRILVVDDNVDAAELLAMVLTDVGHEVTVVHDPPGALECIERVSPEIAILDIGLPVMDGYQLAAELRARMGARTPTLLALTGYGQEHDRRRSRNAGFAFHLLKPVDVDKLLALIDRVATTAEH